MRPSSPTVGIAANWCASDDAEADSSVLLYLPLEVLGEILVALPCYHCKRVHFEAAQSLALLVDTQAQAASDCLPSLALGPDVAKGAYLKDVGAVPPLAQCRMGEDELERCLMAQELLFFPHNQVVGRARRCRG